MFDLTKIFDLSKIFTHPNILLKLKNKQNIISQNLLWTIESKYFFGAFCLLVYFTNTPFSAIPNTRSARLSIFAETHSEICEQKIIRILQAL